MLTPPLSCRVTLPTESLSISELPLLPASGVITRIQFVFMSSACQFMRTWMRPLPLGSSFLVTVATYVSAWGMRASGTGITSRAEGSALKRLR